MATFNHKLRLASGISAGAVAAALLFAQPALAQTTSGIRGQGATAGATVTVTDLVTGRDVTTTVEQDGTFVIVGLRPSTYRIVGAGETQEVVLPVGQTITIDAAPAAEATPGEGAIVVTGRRNRTETRSATIGTSVSQTQIENLPQNDRNFLNFANLAPGVTVSTGANDKKIQAGGVSPDNVNVYIDGTSHKNRVGFNGVAGQNFSQGNPFPQSAVQEFRVETQNFKAEYEQAGSAIISAVTKTGGDKFHGGVFGQYTPKAWIGRPFFDRPGEANNPGFPCPGAPTDTCFNPKPDYKRYQYGGDISGPIIPNLLHFVATYEGTDQSNPSISVNIPPGVPVTSEPSFASDFKQDLYFGKLTLFASDADTMHASYFRREESDVRDFGGNALREHGRDVGTKTLNYQAEWAHRADNWLNEFTAGLFDSDTGTPTLTEGPEIVLTNGVGGGDLLFMGAHFFEQSNKQKDYSVKNNFTYTGFDGHVIKVGVKGMRNTLTRIEDAFANGSYRFAAAGFTNFDSSIPFRATVAILPPTPMTAKNTYIGLFAQDDWTVNDHLTVNYGLRWDYESNNFNNKYVTPAKVATALRNYQPWQAAGIDPEDYITDGGDRDAFMGAFQPRIGISYDVKGDRDLILFAGAGRYYDRNNFYLASLETLFNNIRSDVSVNFCNGPGLPVCSGPGGTPVAGELVWNDSFRDPDAIRAAVGAQGLSGDIWVIKDKTPTPYTDQFNVGVRKRFGDWQTSAAIAHNRSHDAFIFVRGNRMPDGTYTPDGFAYVRDNFPVEGRPAGYTGRVNIGSSKGKAKYTALYLTADKAYAEDSKWGVNVAVTISDAKSNQAIGFGEGQMFNAGEQDAYGWQKTRGLEKWRFVGSGIVGLPFDFRLSTIVTLSAGPRYGNVHFENQPCGGCFTYNDAGVFSPKKTIAYKTVDMRLAKIFKMPWGHEVTADFQVYNLFDWVNRNYSTWGAGFGVNPSHKENGTTGNARTFQAGLKYRF